MNSTNDATIEHNANAPTSYLTLEAFRSDELIIRRSRFIAWGAPVPDEDAALALIEDIRSRHPQATHHCYAYRVGLDAETVRFSDDGEPGGTAGRPILDVLQREQLRNALVVVTRYFGGIQLGAPGLVRAYAQSANLAVATAVVVRQTLHAYVSVEVDYEWLGRVQHELQQHAAIVESTDYAEHVSIRFFVPRDDVHRITAALGEVTNGQANPTVLGQQYKPAAVTTD